MSQYARSDGPCHDETSFAGRGHVATGVPRAWTPRLSGADTYMQSSLCDRACPPLAPGGDPHGQADHERDGREQADAWRGGVRPAGRRGEQG